MNPWMQTYTGKAFDLDVPKVEQVHFEDIARALARTQRWTGHAKRRFSVAEHSVAVAALAWQMAPDQKDPGIYVRAALMHDAHEAYLGDVASPIKELLRRRARGVWDSIVDPIQKVIDERFQIQTNADVELVVKTADSMSLSLERDQIMETSEREWEWDPPKPIAGFLLDCLDEVHAYHRFVDWCRHWQVVD